MQQWQRRLLGILTLGGGFTGLAVGLSLLLAPGSLLVKLLSVPFLGLFTWGMVCGLQLLEGCDDAVRRWKREAIGRTRLIPVCSSISTK